MFHRNHYRHDDEAMVNELVDYDKTVQHYNETRAGGTTDNDWCAHIIGYYREALKYQILDYLKAQGYNITH